MPGNITPANPTAVMPAHLSRSFQEEMRLEADVNMYPDGSSDRNALAQNNRRYFKLAQSLSPDDWKSLRTFFYNNQGQAFYFYNPTGGDPVGRYTVVFDGGWSDTYTSERGEVVSGVFKGYGAQVSIALREIT
jgi:hypothetical protein